MIARSRWVALTAALLALVAVAIVARSHPSHPVTALSPLSRAAGPSPIALPTRSEPRARAAPSASAPPDDSKSTDLHWLGSLLLALLAAGAVLALGRYSRGRWGFSFSDSRARRPAHGVGVPPVQPATPPLELLDAVTHGSGDLAHGPVSDAIIACWVRVEGAARHAGVAPRRSETSTEFVDRVLGSFGAREQSLRRMSALYREARFSTHVMDETSRDDARRCLTEIRDDLGGARDPA